MKPKQLLPLLLLPTVSPFPLFSSPNPTLLISTSGPHAFQPPRSTDHRGPCPALNALANHAYIPRTGLTSVSEASLTAHKVFGLSLPLSRLLATLAVLTAGNPWTGMFSIGDSRPRPSRSNRGGRDEPELGGDLGEGEGGEGGDLLMQPEKPENTSLSYLPHLWGPPPGLEVSRYLFEAPASLVRGDRGGSRAVELVTSVRDVAEEMGVRVGDVRVWREVKRRRVVESRNEGFFVGPVAGVVAGTMGVLLPSALWGGVGLESLLGVVKGEGRFGWERIPEGFMRVRVEKEVSVEAFMEECATILREGVLSLGGVVAGGEWEDVNVGTMTRGAFENRDLENGRGWSCFFIGWGEGRFGEVMGGRFRYLLLPLRVWIEGVIGGWEGGREKLCGKAKESPGQWRMEGWQEFVGVRNVGGKFF